MAVAKKVIVVHRYRSSLRTGKPFTWRRVPDKLITDLKRCEAVLPEIWVVSHRKDYVH
ncbi:hypothetical protein [Acetivibrio cellulolyticus]|uniref:hypothetical protein n=1 Tax=Acetivibrio cellulolyticus TaxID=35830 RepID=UPI0002EA492E|nr:hypothetical protein [Acetivibrio cellulolyticus]